MQDWRQCIVNYNKCDPRREISAFLRRMGDRASERAGCRREDCAIRGEIGMGMRNRWWSAATALAVCVTVACGMRDAGQAAGQAVTRVTVTDDVIEAGATRLGMNLGEQNFYDSGQMLRNLVSRNPGFEGMTYRSVVHCDRAQEDCTETMGGVVWPAGFWDGGSFEGMVRLAAGATDVYEPATASGRIGQSLPTAEGYRVEAASGGASAGAGLEPGEWVRLSKKVPGDAAAGWWTSVRGGARLSTERSDLSPETQGRQALRVEAAMAGESAEVTSYFDSTAGMRFLRFDGEYELRFRAKPLAGAASLTATVGRAGQPVFFSREIALRKGWQDYSFRFRAVDVGQAGTAKLSFAIAGASLLLDDVSLEAVTDSAAQNPTAFRDEVVETLRALDPGVMRLMAGEQLGASMRELLEPRMARERAGYSVWSTEATDVAVGVPEFLELCRAVGAEPWIVIPMGTDAGEAKLLAEYLAGDAASAGGAMRAAEGQAAPWTTVFKRIHLELGNEAWNSIFHGESMEDAGAYGAEARQVFAAFRRAAGSEAAKFDLVVNAQAGVERLPEEQDARVVSASELADSLAIAPYMMHAVDHGATDAELFDPLLAEPEYFATHGLLAEARQAAVAKRLAVYEVNLHSTEGAADQAALDRLTPSLAGGVAVTDLMLRMKRDEGVRDAMVFSLPQYEFRRGDGKQVRLWGSVVDMGPTMRRRPVFVAEAMVNAEIRGDMVRVAVSGANPAHAVARGNDGVEMAAAHDLDFFGFRSRDGQKVHRVLVAYNLSRTAAHAVRVDGVAAGGTMRWSRVGDGDPAASNENSEQVKVKNGFTAGGTLELPACSVTVMEWDE